MASACRKWRRCSSSGSVPKSSCVRKGRGVEDARLDEFRWMLEELRVALFAQELRTPVPMSVKRLQKVWESMQR